MIADTWGGFFTLLCLCAAFWCAGWLWAHETQMQAEERRAARRRAHRYTTKKERQQ